MQQGRTLTARMSATIEWLARDECRALDEAGLAAELGRRLRAAGLPLDHLALYLRTLHPEILGHTIAWVPDEPVQVYRRPHDFVHSAGYLDNPIARVLETQSPSVVRLDPQRGAPWTQADIFRGRPLVEFVVLPLRTPDALPSAVSFATTCSTGFAAAERAAFDRIAPALRNACELRNLRQVELTLLDTYLGTLTGRRVLDGRVRRGELERLEAALLLCDLREFTELSNRLPSERVLELLELLLLLCRPRDRQGGRRSDQVHGRRRARLFPPRRCVGRVRGGLARCRDGAQQPATVANAGWRVAGRRGTALRHSELRQHRLRPSAGFHRDRSGRQSGQPPAGRLQHHRPGSSNVATLCRAAPASESQAGRHAPPQGLRPAGRSLHSRCQLARHEQPSCARYDGSRQRPATPITPRAAAR